LRYPSIDHGTPPFRAHGLERGLQRRADLLGA
jgi:hypothetical protein